MTLGDPQFDLFATAAEPLAPPVPQRASQTPIAVMPPQPQHTRPVIQGFTWPVSIAHAADIENGVLSEGSLFHSHSQHKTGHSLQVRASARNKAPISIELHDWQGQGCYFITTDPAVVIEALRSGNLQLLMSQRDSCT